MSSLKTLPSLDQIRAIFTKVYLLRLAEKVAVVFATGFAGSCIASGLGVKQAVSLSLIQRALSAGASAVVAAAYGVLAKFVGNPDEPAPLPTPAPPQA